MRLLSKEEGPAPARQAPAGPPSTPRSTRTRARDSRFAYLVLLPAVAVITLFIVYPVVAAVDLAVHENHLLRPEQDAFVGLDNFRNALGDPRLLDSVIVTARFTVLTVAGTAILGILIALLLNQPFRGAKVLQVIVLIPWAVPEVIGGVMWRWMFAGNIGVINGALYQLGLIDSYYSFFGNPVTAQASIMTAYFWKHLPLAAILLLASLQVIPRDVYEAAKVDGASVWATFWYVTFPFLKPTLLIVVIFQTLLSFTTFDLVFAMTGGGPANATTLIAWHTYTQIFTNLNLGRGAALGFCIALVTLVMAIFYWRALRTEQLYGTH